MGNPILKKKSNLYNYILIWALVTVAHIFVLYFFYALEIEFALVDGLLYNLLFVGFGLAFWYPVNYTNINTKNFSSLISNHLAAALISVGVWLLIGKFLLALIFSFNEKYLEFLIKTLPWRYISGMFYYFVIVLYYYLMISYANLQDKIKEEQELKSLVQQAELKSLKAQINPHFIFNSLNSISSLTLTNPEKAQKMVIELSDFLRYGINKDVNQKTTLKEELENIDRYLAIEKIRFGERLNYNKEINEDCLSLILPNLILQPLFENVIKHGVNESIDEVKITLSVRCESNQLLISISNSFDVSNKIAGEGVGLKNIRQRLTLVYNLIGLLKIETSNDIFTVNLTIPQE